MAELKFLPLIYSQFNFGLVEKVTDLFKSTAKRSPGLVKAKTVYDYLCTLPGVKVQLYISKESEIYQYNVIGERKSLIGMIYYIPELSRIDVWQASDSIPLVQIKGKKIVFKNYEDILSKFGMDKCFAKLVSLC